MIIIESKRKKQSTLERMYPGASIVDVTSHADDDMVITISHLGYIKRTPLTDFRQQGRGGIGSKASSSRQQACNSALQPSSISDDSRLHSL